MLDGTTDDKKGDTPGDKEDDKEGDKPGDKDDKKGDPRAEIPLPIVLVHLVLSQLFLPKSQRLQWNSQHLRPSQKHY